MKYTNKWMVVPYEKGYFKKFDTPNMVLQNSNLATDVKMKLFNDLLTKSILKNNPEKQLPVSTQTIDEKSDNFDSKNDRLDEELFLEKNEPTESKMDLDMNESDNNNTNNINDSNQEKNSHKDYYKDFIKDLEKEIKKEAKNRFIKNLKKEANTHFLKKIKKKSKPKRLRENEETLQKRKLVDSSDNEGTKRKYRKQNLENHYSDSILEAIESDPSKNTRSKHYKYY